MCTVAHKDGLALVSVKKINLITFVKYSEHYANMMRVEGLKERS